LFLLLPAFHDAYTLSGIRADTPESDYEEDPGRHPSPPSEPPERSPELVDLGRQRAVAAVQAMHPPSLLARISAPVTEKTSNIINNVRSLYVVPDGDQPPGVESDGYRVGLKRKVAEVSRTQYEVYSFATKKNLPEAAVDELLGMLSNVCTKLCALVIFDL